MKDTPLMTLARVSTTELVSRWSGRPLGIRATMTRKSAAQRYWGTLTIEGRHLVFRGRGLKDSAHCEHVIPFLSVIEMLMPMGWHETAPAPSAGAPATAPFVVRYQTESGEEASYFYT